MGNICAIEKADTDGKPSIVYSQILTFLYKPKQNSYIIVHLNNGVEEPNSNKTESRITIDRFWKDPGSF